MAVGGGGVETAAALAGAAAVAVGGGGAETAAALAGAAAVAVGGGGAETARILADAAGLNAGTSALGGALSDNSRLRPTPKAIEKRIVRTIPNGVFIAPVKLFAESIFLFTVIVIGGGRVPLFFCSLIFAAQAIFIAASALLLATTAPETANPALTVAIIAASRATVSGEMFIVRLIGPACKTRCGLCRTEDRVRLWHVNIWED